MLSRPTFNASSPRQIDVHIASSDVITLLDPLVSAELLLNDQVIPNNAEFLFSQKVCRPNDPDHPVRFEQLPGNNIPCGHGALAEPASTGGNAKPCSALVERDLLPVWPVLDRVEVRLHCLVHQLSKLSTARMSDCCAAP